MSASLRTIALVVCSAIALVIILFSKDEEQPLDSAEIVSLFPRRSSITKDPALILIHTHWQGPTLSTDASAIEMLLQSFVVTQDYTHTTRLIFWTDNDWTISTEPLQRYLAGKYGVLPGISFRVLDNNDFAPSCLLTQLTARQAPLHTDVVRLLLLHNYGGVWVDTDCIFLQPIQDLLAVQPNGYPQNPTNNAVLVATDFEPIQAIVELACEIDAESPAWHDANIQPKLGALNDGLLLWCVHKADCPWQPFRHTLVDALWVSAADDTNHLNQFCRLALSSVNAWSHVKDPQHHVPVMLHGHAIKKCSVNEGIPFGFAALLAQRIQQRFEQRVDAGFLDVNNQITHLSLFADESFLPPWQRTFTPLLVIEFSQPDEFAKRQATRRWSQNSCPWTNDLFEKANVGWQYLFVVVSKDDAANPLSPLWLEEQETHDLLILPSESLVHLMKTIEQRFVFQYLTVIRTPAQLLVRANLPMMANFALSQIPLDGQKIAFQPSYVLSLTDEMASELLPATDGKNHLSHATGSCDVLFMPFKLASDLVVQTGQHTIVGLFRFASTAGSVDSVSLFHSFPRLKDACPPLSLHVRNSAHSTAASEWWPATDLDCDQIHGCATAAAFGRTTFNFHEAPEDKLLSAKFESPSLNSCLDACRMTSDCHFVVVVQHDRMKGCALYSDVEQKLIGHSMENPLLYRIA